MIDVLDLRLPILSIARQDIITLSADFTVQQALEQIRSKQLGERIVYFYVVDKKGCLIGVIPTRRLLTAPLDKPLDQLMISKLVTLSEKTTILEAHEYFMHHKLLALPIVNQENHILGLIDVGMFTGENFQAAERDFLRIEEIFETIGFRVSEIRDASSLKAFSLRFRWLLATIGSGTTCALLSSIYELTLAKSLILAFFLTLVLGLGESVSMQSMTVTINALRRTYPSLKWYTRACLREITTGLMLGSSCGLIVGLIAWLWRGEGVAAIAIGLSILLAICAACFFGLSIPAVLHMMKLDPKVAAGPVILAMTDICTVLVYFSLATILL